jgi:hypothetical protein
MATESKPSGGGPGEALLFLLGIIGVFFLLWYVGGGPERAQNQTGPTAVSFSSLFTPPVPQVKLFSGGGFGIGSGYGGTSETDTQRRQRVQYELENIDRALNELEEDIKQARIRGSASPYENLVEIGYDSWPQGLFRHEEYVVLRANYSNTIDINVTGWQLESTITGKRARIGTVTNIPRTGLVNPQIALVLPPGGSATVVTGRSPLGTSFRLNKCTGYLEQFQNFRPRLPLNCPTPREEFKEYAKVPTTSLRSDRDAYDRCEAFVGRLRRCEIYRDDLRDVEPSLHRDCRDFVDTYLSYGACLRNHQSDVNFYDDTWRVYLNAEWELWRDKRDIIRLLDEAGRTVDVYMY